GAPGFAKLNVGTPWRAWESAAPVTVQVFRTTKSAEVCSATTVKPSASSSRRMAVASASVARHPKFSMEKVAIVLRGLRVFSEDQGRNYSREPRRLWYAMRVGKGWGEGDTMHK